MLGGRGVALGLGGRMNLAELSRGYGGGPSSYYRKQQQQQTNRRCSEGTSKSSNGVKLGPGYRPTPHRHHCRQSHLAQILDVESEGDTMDPATKPLGRKRLQKLQEEEEKKKVTVKRPFDRRTFWAACRAIIFGTLMVLLGAAMCTIGYYNEYFAMETVHLADNITTIAPNPTKKFQFQSLTYIGPVIMGAGAFILMMACVTTLESRDRQARIQAQIDAERTPLSRRNTGSKGPPAPSATPGPSALKPSAPQTATSAADASSSEPERGIRKVEQPKPPKPELVPKPAVYQPAELIAPPAAAAAPVSTGNGSVVMNAHGNSGGGGGGVVNRSFTRDDSKTTSKPDTDSGPSGTTTTTLTWSKNGGPRVEADVVSNKYPSTSCIDNLIRKPDERALLQRFLEDQSRLVEDRLNRRVQQQGPQKEEDGFRSASLDAPTSAKIAHSCSRNFRSEEMPPRKNVVAAEVHHAGDASPSYSRIPTSTDAGSESTSSSNPFVQAPATPEMHFVNPSTSMATIQEVDAAGGLKAPVIAPDTLELFSPMSVSPDTPASIAQQKQLSKSQILSPTYPPPAPSRPHSPDIDRSISGSYVTVVDGDDDFRASMDLFNANVASNTPVQRLYNTFSNAYHPQQQPDWSSSNAKTTDTGNKKLYDSVFLAENLRQMASVGQQPQPPPPFLSIEYTPKEKTAFDVDEMRSPEQTGVLGKDWQEMNANYLRNQQKL